MNNQVNPVNFKQVDPSDKEKNKQLMIRGGIILVITAILGTVGKYSTFCCVLSFLGDVVGLFMLGKGGFGLFRYSQADKVANAPTVTLIATQMKGHIEIHKEWKEREVISSSVDEVMEMVPNVTDDGYHWEGTGINTTNELYRTVTKSEPLFIVDIDENDDYNSVIRQCEMSCGRPLDSFVYKDNDERRPIQESGRFSERIRIDETYTITCYKEGRPETPLVYNVARGIWDVFRTGNRQVINTSLINESKKYINDRVTYI